MIPGVPYDAEIEYLESTGTQWIDTGLSFSGVDRLVFSTTVKQAGTGSEWCMLGANSGSNEVLVWHRANKTYLNGKSATISFAYNTEYDIDLVVTKGAASLAVDGNTVLTSTGKNNGKHVYLFGSISSASGTTLDSRNYQVFKYCKIYSGTTLVRDFIPVRVGQVGYMYDRVSRKLFGNRGTGSFVLGPDVARPVMGLWGMRGSKSIDYLRDGLVALWDGIDNAGYNKHDPKATVWKDLTDNHYDLTSNGTPAWRYNGAYIHAKANSYHRNSCDWFRSLWSSSSGVYVECVCSLGREIIFGFGGQQRTYESFDFTAKTVNNSTKYCEFILGNRTANTSFSDGSIGRVYGWANASSYKIKFNNASELTGSYTYQTSSKNGLGIGCRGDNYGNAYLYNGVMHRIAVYSRALSPAEIAHNYAIDKARFNLP